MELPVEETIPYLPSNDDLLREIQSRIKEVKVYTLEAVNLIERMKQEITQLKIMVEERDLLIGSLREKIKRKKETIELLRNDYESPYEDY